MQSSYRVSIVVDSKRIDISQASDTNYREGAAAQLADIFYRAMLAIGYSPALSCEALGRVATAGGYPIRPQQNHEEEIISA